MKTPLFTGTIARYTIQCVHPVTGKIGNWLFTGDNHRDPDSIVSPLFTNLMALFVWAQENNFESVGDAYRYTGNGRHGAQVETAMAIRHPNVI